MKLGIFGGSFNPIHRGHYEIVRQILALRKVDRVFVVPAYRNPFKADSKPLPAALRLELIKATFKEVSEVEVLSTELEQPELSYTYLTLEKIRAQYPQDELFLILGSDAFSLFHQWKKAKQILKLASLLVFRRQLENSLDLEPALELVGNQVEWLDLELPRISSTEIRIEEIEGLTQKKWLHPQALKVWVEAQK